MPRVPRYIKFPFKVRVRRSTLVLIAAFVAVWILYEGVRPAPTKSTLVPYGPAPVVTVPTTIRAPRTTVTPPKATTTTLPSANSTTVPPDGTTTTSLLPGVSTTTSVPPPGSTTAVPPSTPGTPTSGR